MLVGCGKEEKPQEAFDTYVKAWNKQKFADMYDQLSKNAQKDISKKEFTEKYEKGSPFYSKKGKISRNINFMKLVLQRCVEILKHYTV